MLRFLLIFCLFFSIRGVCQPPISSRGSASVTALDQNLFVGSSFKLPVYADTTAASLAISTKAVKDTVGLQIYTSNDRTAWVRTASPKSWIRYYSDSAARAATSTYTTTPFRQVSSATSLTLTDGTIRCTANTFSIITGAINVKQIVSINNIGAGVVTLTGSTYDGEPSIILNPGHRVQIQYTGSDYTVLNQY
jgi:hypothetical protein